VGSNKVARIRRRVLLPAPLAPSKATASPGATSSEIVRSAGMVGWEKGCSMARQPLSAGGNHFSRDAVVIAETDTPEFIACIKKENNVPVGRVDAHGSVAQSQGKIAVTLQALFVQGRLLPAGIAEKFAVAEFAKWNS
jgi:hypothetical protein